MPTFVSDGQSWTPVPNPEHGKKPEVPAAEEGKVTVKPERRAKPKATRPPKEETSHA